jgi:Cu/Ag efflux pump CusA
MLNKKFDIIVLGAGAAGLMTALTAALALIPLAMQGDLPGNEIQSPMAQVILGGLLTSTLLNIFIVPIVYSILNNRGIIKTEKA